MGMLMDSYFGIMWESMISRSSVRVLKIIDVKIKCFTQDCQFSQAFLFQPNKLSKEKMY